MHILAIMMQTSVQRIKISRLTITLADNLHSIIYTRQNKRTSIMTYLPALNTIEKRLIK